MKKKNDIRIWVQLGGLVGANTFTVGAIILALWGSEFLDRAWPIEMSWRVIMIPLAVALIVYNWYVILSVIFKKQNNESSGIKDD